MLDKGWTLSPSLSNHRVILTIIGIFVLNITPLPFNETIKRSLNQTISNATQALINQQQEDGYWQYELESDSSISTQYILMLYFMDDVDEVLQYKVAHYLRSQQIENGGFPLFPGGPGDVSLTTKAYFVLKLAGDSVDENHMEKARTFILSQGGAAKCNVLTRILLATFGQMPWRGTPFIPVEIILLPKWFPMNIYTLSYWARTVIVPLSILSTLKPKAKNTGDINILELFVVPPELEQHYFDDSSFSQKLCLVIDKLGEKLESIVPKWIRKRAIKKSIQWIDERLNGEDGLGGLMPAMLYAYEAMDVVGVPQDDPRMIAAKKAMKRLLVINKKTAYCQPAFSPVWDTAFAMIALNESKHRAESTVNKRAADWLAKKQLTTEPGDWRERCPNYKAGGGWAFQFNSPHYPDIDDTAIAAFALLRTEESCFDINIDNAAQWLRIMQSKNGGFGAYDADNTNRFVDASPLADYISLIDPPTADITARCVMFLANMVKQQPEVQETIDKAINFLWQEQEEDGSWFGRWGCNYIYGTWSVLYALEQAGIPNDDQRIKLAVKWLKNTQNQDGGWGEDNLTYHDSIIHKRGQYYLSTAFQTAWALLGLIAAGEAHSIEVKKGVHFLSSTQQDNGHWQDSNFSGAGFPKAVYLKYHGYGAYFPLWALARYRNFTY